MDEQIKQRTMFLRYYQFDRDMLVEELRAWAGTEGRKPPTESQLRLYESIAPMLMVAYEAGRDGIDLDTVIPWMKEIKVE